MGEEKGEGEGKKDERVGTRSEEQGAWSKEPDNFTSTLACSLDALLCLLLLAPARREDR
jgi:hypothetical protein